MSATNSYSDGPENCDAKDRIKAAAIDLLACEKIAAAKITIDSGRYVMVGTENEIRALLPPHIDDKVLQVLWEAHDYLKELIENDRDHWGMEQLQQRILATIKGGSMTEDRRESRSRNEPLSLLHAAEAVVWFDWSGNGTDDDALASIERLREAVELAQRSEIGTWRTFDTLPTDFQDNPDSGLMEPTRVLALSMTNYVSIEYVRQIRALIDSARDEGEECFFIRWMPLPEAQR